MADYVIKRFEEMDTAFGGVLTRARAELGISSFGMQLVQLPAGAEFYPEHDQSDDGQEEVYVPIDGGGEVEIDGERHPVEPGLAIRVSAGTTRKFHPGPDGLRMLAVGGIPGAVYSPPGFTEIGAPDPAPTQ